MAAQLQFEFPNFELWHAGTACDHLGVIASQRFRFCVSRLNNLAFWVMLLRYRSCDNRLEFKILFCVLVYMLFHGSLYFPY
jgi:hypothetical protein